MIARARAQPGDIRRDGRGERVPWQAGQAGSVSFVCCEKCAGRQWRVRNLAAWARARALKAHAVRGVFEGVRKPAAPAGRDREGVRCGHTSPRVTTRSICVDCGQCRNSMNRVLLLTDSGLRRDVECGVCPLHPRPCVSRRL